MNGAAIHSYSSTSVSQSARNNDDYPCSQNDAMRALLARVWKGEAYVTERSVDTLIKRIRRKLDDDAANPALILTVWGSGYKAADV